MKRDDSKSIYIQNIIKPALFCTIHVSVSPPRCLEFDTNRLALAVEISELYDVLNAHLSKSLTSHPAVHHCPHVGKLPAMAAVDPDKRSFVLRYIYADLSVSMSVV